MAVVESISPQDLADISPINSPPKAHSLQKILIKTPEDLRIFFNDGGIEELATPLDYLLENGAQGAENARVCIAEEKLEGPTAEFSAYWLHQMHQNESRILVVQSNLSYIAGLFLQIPVQLDSYNIAHGTISASYNPRLPQGKHRIGHYLKKGAAAPHIGEPATAVRVHRIATRQLLRACQIFETEKTNYRVDDTLESNAA